MASERKGFPITRRQFVTSSGAAALAFSGFPAKAGATPGVVGEAQDTTRGPWRVIIDTDPGVDDALALLLAMR
ncbi:MAG: hypothetical protein WCA16_18745, partial [Candidatus Sulfotelmatobacter sp.]